MADILGDAVTFYARNLASRTTSSAKAIDYLYGRKILSGAMDYFRLGHTGEAGALSDHMKSLGYTVDTLIDAGLLFEYSPDYYIETFRNSIIIPYIDAEGRVLNICSRKLDVSKVKYINLPHTKIHGYYGLHTLPDRFKYGNLVDKGCVVIAEGQFDTISLQQHGVFTLGILGTNGIRPSMFGECLGLFDSVITCFDPDKPGQDAAKRFASHVRFHHPCIRIYNIEVPGEKDVNDFLLNNCIDELLSCTRLVEGIIPREFKERKIVLLNKTDIEKTEELSAIKKASILSIVQKIQPHTKIVKSSGHYKTLCPFKDHTENIGSFAVYKENNSYFCFGCGRGGDVINFVMEYFGISFKEAVVMLKTEKKGEE